MERLSQASDALSYDGGWLCPTPADRVRLVEMSPAVRRARLLAGLFAGVGVFALVPWLGWVPVAVFALVPGPLLLLDRLLARARRPERFVAASLSLHTCLILVGVSITGGVHSPLLPWVAIPIVTAAARFRLPVFLVGSLLATLALVLAATPAGLAHDPAPLIGVVVLLSALVVVQQPLLDAERRWRRARCELQEAHDELAALATTDFLTTLPNHRAMVLAIDHELERRTRYGRQFALCFLDLDNFKEFNDALGHAAGDGALRETAEVIRGSARGVDIVGRWGGEEFIVLLPETDSAGALDAAERIRAAIARHSFASAQGAHLTCSIGVAVCPGDGSDRDTLLSGADQAMYASKRLGRNQVIAASDRAAAALAADADAVHRDGHLLFGAVEALVALVDARDRYTAAHSTEVANLCRQAALALGCDANEAHVIGLAARLHDIGKVAVPDAVLTKRGRLDSDEWELIRRHPMIGADIAGRIPALCDALPLIRGHHERFDGCGYPDGLAGDQIPLGARIISVADAFSAMITDRPYRSGIPAAHALEELQRHAGTQFDPRVVDAVLPLTSAYTRRRAA